MLQKNSTRNITHKTHYVQSDSSHLSHVCGQLFAIVRQGKLLLASSLHGGKTRNVPHNTVNFHIPEAFKFATAIFALRTIGFPFLIWGKTLCTLSNLYCPRLDMSSSDTITTHYSSSKFLHTFSHFFLPCSQGK